jgi:uncharacterized protein YcfJ
MWKKVLISGAVGAAILGAGGTALAASGDSSPAPAPTSSSPSTHSGHAKAKAKVGTELRRALYGSLTTKGKDGKFVTHDAIRGTVTAVSPTSITVKAADNTSETYAVTSTTKVRDDKTSSTIGAVKVNDVVGVLGTGSGTLTATHIIDRGIPTKASSTN